MAEDSADIHDFYEFDKVLGEGQFGQVRKAIKRDTGEAFAVKIIDKNALESDDLVYLQQEVEILTQIDHPNVVKLYEIFEDDQYFYMVLELMMGGELFQRIVEQEQFSESQALEQILPVIDALHYCHSMNIAHRDLKPENLLYASKERGALLKISDFGLARFINNEVMMTQVGTPGYIAPEIIEGRGYDIGIDYWSIGIILYIMLSGQPPFYSENNEELFMLIKQGKYAFPSPTWDQISEQAKDLIRGLLQTDPKRRITYEQVIKHPWVVGKGINNKPLLATKTALKEFNAQKQMKKIGTFLQAVSLLNKIGKKDIQKK